MILKDTNINDLDIAVAYTYDVDEAKLWVKEIEDYFKIKNVRMDPLSLSVATHIGPGALAIAVSKKY